MAELKPMEIIMRIDYASSNGIEVVAHAERVQELVRCKDCKYFEHDSVEKINGIPLIVAHEICRRSTGLVYATSNDYCSRGERKETENEEIHNR